MARNLTYRLLAGTAFSMLAALPVVAQAQTNDASPAPQNSQAQTSDTSSAQGDAAATKPSDDIVVTGTLIRGIAPVGTNVVGLSKEDITASGARTSNEVLAQIPQITNYFNTVPSVPAASIFYVTQRPNLRDLGGDASGTATLLLIDGHRAVNSGFFTAPDPDVIPPGLLERVDVIPDGGSATYGSDAVGGVINFVTRKRFNGVEASAHYGFADDYYSVDANVTVGKDWGSGSLYASYAFLKHDAIYGRDRDYVQQVSIPAGYCAPGTVITGGVSYAIPGLQPNTMSQCDDTDNTTIIPSEERHSVFAGLTQQLNDSLTFELKGYYTRRLNMTAFDRNLAGNAASSGGQTVTLDPSNPNYHPFFAGDTRPQEVRFSYAGVVDGNSYTSNDVYQITPQLTAHLGSGWELRVLGSFGEGDTRWRSIGLDGDAQTLALATGALNPYDIAGMSQAARDQIFYTTTKNTRQAMTDARAILDGRLFTLPGGEVKLAIGAEYTREEVRTLNVDRGVAVINANTGRHTGSVFGEIQVPLVSSINASPFLQELTLSASGRYDDYSDFGDTFNPKFGVTYRPGNWLRIRANWGKSFNAPSLVDRNAPDTRAIIFPFNPLTGAPGTSVVLGGGDPALKPQRAETWSVGADLTPVDGLSLSGTYYNIRLKDQITFPTQALLFTPAYANVIYYVNPSAEVVQAAIAGQPLEGFPQLLAGPVSSMIDLRKRNLGFVKQDGIDFDASYTVKTGFGSVFASGGGTYTLHRNVKVTPIAAFQNYLTTPGQSRFLLQANLGMTTGGFTGRATFNHRQGYDLNPAIGVTGSRYPAQYHVDSFDTVDLFFAYDVKGQGLFQNLSFTLNVSNLLDQDPPFYNEPMPIFTAAGFTNGSTYGRFIQFGVRKKF